MAMTYTVSSTSDDISDQASLRYAISQAVDGDTINFAEGLSGQTIRITQTLNLTKGVIIDGGSDTTVSSLSADGQTQNEGSIFSISGGTSTNPVTIQNLAINDGRSTGDKGAFGTPGSQGGNSTQGVGEKGGPGGPGGLGSNTAGGIYVQSGFIVLTNDSFTNNQGTGGSGGLGGPGGQGGTGPGGQGEKGAKGAGGDGGNGAGAVYVEPGATVVLASDLTFSGNVGAPGAVGIGDPLGSGGTGYEISNSQAIRDAAVCYATGTGIRTMGGEVAVETLRVGDFVVTGSGAMRPIHWIGHRKVACRRHPQASLVMPVRIAAGAFGPGRPARDLTVSPAHAICVEVDGGEVLIPAVRLINGTTVARIEVESVTYWHVELDSHDILLAEGLPAESYLDCGNRGFFANAAVTSIQAVPDERPDGALPFCRPFYETGPVVEAVRAQLEQRARSLGWSLDAEPAIGLHLLADGRVIQPQMDGMSANFVLPAGARDVRLVSGMSAPAHVVSGSADDRRLGVSIRGLVFDDGVTGAREIALNDPRLSLGFHPMDRDASGTVWRWTDGSAALPASLWAGCRGAIRMQIALAGTVLPRWIGPAPKSDLVAMGGLRRQA